MSRGSHVTNFKESPFQFLSVMQQFESYSGGGGDKKIYQFCAPRGGDSVWKMRLS